MKGTKRIINSNATRGFIKNPAIDYSYCKVIKAHNVDIETGSGVSLFLFPVMGENLNLYDVCQS